MTSKLQRFLGTLPPARRTAVIDAYTAWVAAGSTSAVASRSALQYAKRLALAAKTAQARADMTSTERAAARMEPEFRRIYLDAVAAAQSKLSLTTLETALASREVPWHLLEPAIEAMKRELDG